MKSFHRMFERTITQLAVTLICVLLLASLASIHSVVEYSRPDATTAAGAHSGSSGGGGHAADAAALAGNQIISNAMVAASAVLITTALALLLGIRLYRRRLAPLVQRLEDSEGRYRAIAELSVAGISITDRDMNIVFANPALERMLDCAPGALTGRNVAEFADDAQAARFRSNLAERIRGEGPGRYEATLRRRNGDAIICSISAAGMLDRDGCYNGTLAVIMDITCSKRAEAELVRLKDAAEAAARTKDAFLANISHEFRSPLHIILGFARQARRRVASADPERLDSYLMHILESGSGLLDLVNELLDLSRLDARAARFEMADRDLAALAAAVIDEFDALVVDRGITLRLHVPETEVQASVKRHPPLRIKATPRITHLPSGELTKLQGLRLVPPSFGDSQACGQPC